MIAFCLDRLGLDPAFLIGGDVPQLGGNARAGEGWLVVEGDESDRSVAGAAPGDRRAPQRRPRPPHDLRVARRGRGAVRGVARARRRTSCAASSSSPRRSSSRSRASTTGATPRPRSRRSSSPASTAPRPSAAIVRVHAASAAGSSSRRRPACRRQLRAPSGRARRRPRRRCGTAGACSRSSSRISTRARWHLAHEFAAALAAADAVCVTEIYPAREEPIPGVSGKLIVDELARVRPGMRVGWAPSLEDAARVVAAGRGRATRSLDARRRATSTARRCGAAGEARGVELSRYTTLGTGGPARAFARAGDGGRGRGAPAPGACRVGDDRARLEPARRRRGRRRARAEARRRARRRRDRRRRRSARAAAPRTRSCLHRARAAGLGGFEFACAIPGTIGGGIWMNGGAYGGDFSRRARAGARGHRRRDRTG